MDNKRSDKDCAKLALLMLRAKVDHDQIGYWDDLNYDQGSESVFKAQKIADRQIDPAIAKEIMDFASNSFVKVNGVWYLDALPNNAVVELEDGTLAKFFINPFRELKQKDFTVYKGYHPRKCKGSPLPLYLYRFYGLVKTDDNATETIHVRVTQKEKEKAETYANNEGKTVSEIVRDYIKGL